MWFQATQSGPGHLKRVASSDPVGTGGAPRPTGPRAGAAVVRVPSGFRGARVSQGQPGAISGGVRLSPCKRKRGVERSAHRALLRSAGGVALSAVGAPRPPVGDAPPAGPPERSLPDLSTDRPEAARPHAPRPRPPRWVLGVPRSRVGSCGGGGVRWGGVAARAASTGASEHSWPTDGTPEASGGSTRPAGTKAEEGPGKLDLGDFVRYSYVR